MDYISCTIKELPEHERHAAARKAATINPANRPALTGLIAAGLEITPQRIAVMTTKFWGVGGVHLTVGFFSQAAAALQEKILSHMNAWGQYCNAVFSLVHGSASSAQVRISLGGGGYWSYLGTDVAHIPANQPTMNLQEFNLSTPESEYKRVVRHETGHTLGCPHEHMRAEIVARLNPQKTIAYFQATQGWSPTEIQQQVLTPISESALIGATPHAETDSIMCYGLPASITNDGQLIPGGTDITNDDALYMGKLYPLTVTPPQPPPPPSAGNTITLSSAMPAGKYKLVPTI